MPGRVLALCGSNTALAPAIKPWISTPWTRVMTSTTTMAVPMNCATSSLTCHRLMKYRANTLTASIRTRDAPTTAEPTAAAMISVRI